MTDDKLTIVGPEPTMPVFKTPQKSVNIEALLLMAKYDDDFKKRLFEDREKALSESEISFTAGEKLLLTNISDEQLAQNIEEFHMSGITKKSLPSWAKAASVILLLTSIMFYGSDGSAFMPTLGIPPDKVRKMREEAKKKKSFTQIGNFSIQMAKTLKNIKKELETKSIEEILKGNDYIAGWSFTNSDYVPKIDLLVNEIKEKVNAGMDINHVIYKYEAIIGKTDPDFSKIKEVSYQMAQVLWQIQDELASMKIEDVLKEYDVMILEDSKKPEKKRRVKPEIIELLNEVKEKVKSGINGYYVADKLVAHIYKMGVGEPAGMRPDDRSPFKILSPSNKRRPRL